MKSRFLIISKEEKPPLRSHKALLRKHAGATRLHKQPPGICVLRPARVGKLDEARRGAPAVRKQPGQRDGIPRPRRKGPVSVRERAGTRARRGVVGVVVIPVVRGVWPHPQVAPVVDVVAARPHHVGARQRGEEEALEQDRGLRRVEAGAPRQREVVPAPAREGERAGRDAVEVRGLPLEEVGREAAVGA